MKFLRIATNRHDGRVRLEVTKPNNKVAYRYIDSDAYLSLKCTNLGASHEIYLKKDTEVSGTTYKLVLDLGSSFRFDFGVRKFYTGDFLALTIVGANDMVDGTITSQYYSLESTKEVYLKYHPTKNGTADRLEVVIPK